MPGAELSSGCRPGCGTERGVDPTTVQIVFRRNELRNPRVRNEIGQQIPKDGFMPLDKLGVDRQRKFAYESIGARVKRPASRLVRQVVRMKPS